VQDANQVLLLVWLIENPRWLPTAGHSLMYDPMGNMIKTNSAESFDHILKDDHHRTISATFWPTWLTCLDSTFFVKNIVCNDIRHFFPILQDCRDHAC
jgi:hypothetical protein